MSMSDEQLKQELEKILPGLDESAMFDNDGELMGYVEDWQVENHQELLDKKNDLIKAGEISQLGFEVILFNYGENDVIMPELRFWSEEEL